MTGEQPRDVADVYSEDGYYAVVPEWVLDADISAQAVRLYAVLRRYADQRTMHANPSRRTLADRLKAKDEKVVDRAIADLQRIGAVDVIPRWRNEDGHIAYAPDGDHRERTSNGYHLRRRPADLPEGTGGGANAPTPPVSMGGGGVEAPTVGAQKGEEPQPCEPQPSLPSGERRAGARSRRARVQVPADWQPSAELAAWTSENYPGMPRTEVAAFVDKHRSVGNTFLDLDAAWRTWCRNWKKYGSRTGRAPYRDQRVAPSEEAQQQIGPPASDGWDAYLAGGQQR